MAALGSELADRLALEYQERPSRELYRKIVELMLPTIQYVANSGANTVAAKKMGVDHCVGSGALIIRDLLKSYKQDAGISFSRYCYYALFQRLPSWDRIRGPKKRRIEKAQSLYDVDGEIMVDIQDYRQKEDAGDPCPAIQMAIDGLELREQYIVKMRFFSGITNEKIAATLGIHPTRISHMMPEIVEKLRRKLWGYYAAANH